MDTVIDGDWLDELHAVVAALPAVVADSVNLVVVPVFLVVVPVFALVMRSDVAPPTPAVASRGFDVFMAGGLRR